MRIEIDGYYPSIQPLMYESFGKTLEDHLAQKMDLEKTGCKAILISHQTPTNPYAQFGMNPANPLHPNINVNLLSRPYQAVITSSAKNIEPNRFMYFHGLFDTIDHIDSRMDGSTHLTISPFGDSYAFKMDVPDQFMGWINYSFNTSTKTYPVVYFEYRRNVDRQPTFLLRLSDIGSESHGSRMATSIQCAQPSWTVEYREVEIAPPTPAPGQHVKTKEQGFLASILNRFKR